MKASARKKQWRPAILIFVIAAVLLGSYNIYILFHPKVKTEIARSGVIEETVLADGYVVRDEVIEAQNAGMIVDSMAMDGERVAKGANIAILYDASVDPKVQSDLKSIQSKLNSLNRLKSQNSVVTSGDATRMESITGEKVSEAIRYAHLGDGSQLNEIKMQLEEIINKKLVSEGENTDYVIESLQQEKQNLEDSITGDKKMIYASTSGLYYTGLDGYENLLAAEDIQTLTPSSFEQLYAFRQSDESAKSGIRIVKGYTWYIVSLVDTNKIAMLKEGSGIKIRFPEFGSDMYDATVQYISSEENGKSVLACSCSAFTQTVFLNRRLKTEFVLNVADGLKISKDAIRVVDGETGVLIIKDSIVRFRPVEVLGTDNDDVIIRPNNTLDASGVLLYDEVIVRGDHLNPGDMWRG